MQQRTAFFNSYGEICGLEDQLSDKAKNPYLVKLRSGSHFAPIFCIHPAGGDAAVYKPLADALPSGHPVFGIQSRCLAGASAEHESLQELVEAYADTICATLDGHPVCLVGFSLGGLIATLLAKELEIRGEDVLFVGLVESVADLGEDSDAAHETLTNLVVTTYEYVRQEISLLRQVPSEALTRDSSELAGKIAASVLGANGGIFLDWIRAKGYLTTFQLPQAAVDHPARIEKHLALLSQYPPSSRIDAPVPIWQAEERAAARARPHGGHDTGNSAVKIIPGNHYTAMQAPHVRIVAEDIADQLGEIGAAPYSR